jgi:hypothetical protein
MKGQLTMSKNGKFIITKDENTADQLEMQGCTMINFQNGVYVFLNDCEKMNFSKLEKKSYKITNNMHF